MFYCKLIEEEVALDLVGNDFSVVVNDFGIPDGRECRHECHLEWKAMVGIKVTSSYNFLHCNQDDIKYKYRLKQ